VIALGSTLSVSPANAIPMASAQAGAPYIIINRDETDHDSLAQVTLRLTGNVEELFPPAVEEAL
jgi:NAD-dependent SIR2 family protein deacetylase